jgi:hypothetical protein
MWVLATGVAGIAAVVSYSHIYDLGRMHGGAGAPGRLLPFSVDMLIVVGELMLLHEADENGNRFWLGRVLVSSGILATMAANLAYGARYGITGALIWGWPADSFVLVAAGMISVMKQAARRQGSAPLARFRRMCRATPRPRRWPRCGPLSRPATHGPTTSSLTGSVSPARRRRKCASRSPPKPTDTSRQKNNAGSRGHRPANPAGGITAGILTIAYQSRGRPR